MSTRYLTVVIADKKPVIAQYGHYDGEPYTNGVKILSLLHRDTEQHIKTQLHRCTNLEESEYRSFFKDNHLDEEALEKAHPKFWWSDGADLLETLLDTDQAIETRDYFDFAYDSLQCEWAYVIDYDENVFEVYKGWSKKPIKYDERFFNDGKDMNGYYPVRLIARYLLNHLPSVKDFRMNAWYEFEDMKVKVISVKTPEGVNQSENRALYIGIEDFVGYIPEIIIGKRMWLMNPNRGRSRIHTTHVMSHTKEENIHTVTTLNSIYIFEELEKEESK